MAICGLFLAFMITRITKRTLPLCFLGEKVLNVVNFSPAFDFSHVAKRLYACYFVFSSLKDFNGIGRFCSHFVGNIFRAAVSASALAICVKSLLPATRSAGWIKLWKLRLNDKEDPGSEAGSSANFLSRVWIVTLNISNTWLPSRDQNHLVNKLKKLQCYNRQIIKTGLYVFLIFKYSSKYFAQVWSRHVGVLPRPGDINMPENSVNIWNLLWLSRSLLISYLNWLSTFPNTLTSKQDKNPEISIYF